MQQITLNPQLVKAFIKLHKTKSGNTNHFQFRLERDKKNGLYDIDYYPAYTAISMNSLAKDTLDTIIIMLQKDFSEFYDNMIHSKYNPEKYLHNLQNLDKVISKDLTRTFSIFDNDKYLGSISTCSPDIYLDDIILAKYPEAEYYEIA